MTQLPRQTHVAVVGAGPAGLVAAVSLARAGVEVVVLDKRTGVSDLPRAVGVTVRQMEIFRSWGIEAELRACADDVDLTLLEVTTVAEASAGVRRQINVPDHVQSEVVSPTSSVRVAQDDLELVLLDELARHKTATVCRGVEVAGLEQDADGVDLVVRAAHDPTAARVRARYVIGADGARSTVRQLLGIDVVGATDVMRGVSAEFRAPLWPVLGERRHALYSIRQPNGSGILIPAGGGTRWQYGVVLGPDDDAHALSHPSVLTRRIRAAVGVPDVGISIARTSTFVAGATLAERYSLGRVHLVGDAAHRVTPRGGNGLAMAVRDGLALGWRLAWVAHGWAPPGFLDTYEEEMRPLAAADVARAADPDGGCHTVLTELLHDLGGRLQHAWLPPSRPGEPPRSTLDLVSGGLTLLTGAEGPWAGAAAGLPQRLPVEIAVLPPPTLHALGIRPLGALLVRPDGVPVAGWYGAATVDRATADLTRAIGDLLTPIHHPEGATR
ncbi:FAD-dependent monooxygenase [Nocardioides sp. SYSU D00038]|uniref:FAD-dependent monooxygenase n=1 Tax=Nocardioides sp. SYSU D00038 TaxID=2812554 RepID=UPI0019685102|nr:FAD-dependent monooxygenase [Nocardioides sp. SYSU D00038]